jgi:hypothetical protein
LARAKDAGGSGKCWRGALSPNRKSGVFYLELVGSKILKRIFRKKGTYFVGIK